MSKLVKEVKITFCNFSFIQTECDDSNIDIDFQFSWMTNVCKELIFRNKFGTARFFPNIL